MPQEKPERCDNNCATSETGYAMVRGFEGLRLFRYKDAAGFDTIGFGHLILPTDVIEEPLMPDDADALLKKDMKRIERGVNRLVTTPLWQPQFDALASFTFNLGEGRLSSSTLLKRVNAGRHSDVLAEFKKWCYAGGKKLLGLVMRRMAEASLYSSW